MMLRLVSLCLFAWIILVNAWINPKQFNAFKKSDGKYVFVRLRAGEALDIPDSETLATLGFVEANVTSITDDELSKYKKLDAIPSLKPANGYADEKMRVSADTILAFDSSNYWTESKYLIGHGSEMRSYNPGMVKLRKDKILFCWRSTDYNSQIMFGWYDHFNHSITVDSSIKVYNSMMLGGLLSPMQDDARLIKINKTHIGVTFSGVFGGNMQYGGQIQQMFAYLSYDEATNKVEFKNGSAYVAYEAYNQKNWTPFIYKNELLLMQEMKQSVVKKPNLDFPNDESTHNIKHCDTIAHAPAVKNFPWDEKLYGHIRGGTPAIMVRGKYFALFHTQASIIGGMYTYFMGAVTYCPNPPFLMHSISPVPMMKKNLYDGAWSTKAINYVLYPVGIVVDDREEIAHVSLGYQDKHGYIIKLVLAELFNVMDVVNEC